ncbi:MAG: hypothetical protein E6295_11215, partial [Streptococcus sp.]|nr:hypothetical protein [Streptococcus sp.]
IDAAAFIFSATASTCSAFLAIIASLISFTSVIIFGLGTKKFAPKPRHESTNTLFHHYVLCLGRNIMSTAPLLS